MKLNVDYIKLLAAQQGMNYGDLAEKANISRQTLSTIFTRKTCRPDTVVKLCRALGIDPNQIIIQEE